MNFGREAGTALLSSFTLSLVEICKLAVFMGAHCLQEPQDVVRETQKTGSLLGLSEERMQAMLSEQPRWGSECYSLDLIRAQPDAASGSAIQNSHNNLHMCQV